MSHVFMFLMSMPAAATDQASAHTYKLRHQVCFFFETFDFQFVHRTKKIQPKFIKTKIQLQQNIVTAHEKYVSALEKLEHLELLQAKCNALSTWPQFPSKKSACEACLRNTNSTDWKCYHQPCPCDELNGDTNSTTAPRFWANVFSAEVQPPMEYVECE